MSGWASLGGFGNVSMKGALPIGRTNNAGALGLIAELLMRHGAMQRQPAQQPEDSPEVAELLARLFGKAAPDPAHQARAGY